MRSSSPSFGALLALTVPIADFFGVLPSVLVNAEGVNDAERDVEATGDSEGSFVVKLLALTVAVVDGFGELGTFSIDGLGVRDDGGDIEGTGVSEGLSVVPLTSAVTVADGFGVVELLSLKEEGGRDT